MGETFLQGFKKRNSNAGVFSALLCTYSAGTPPPPPPSCSGRLSNLRFHIQHFRRSQTSRVSDKLKKPRVSENSRVLQKLRFRVSENPGVLRKHQEKAFNRDVETSSGGAAQALDYSKDFITDLSQLFLGQKFASGSHSRIYLGFYKQQAMAVKLIMRQKENAALDEQFSHEVALLSRRHHRGSKLSVLMPVLSS